MKICTSVSSTCLYRHALTLLDLGVDVILEDGSWTRVERCEKFADARAHGADISWHIFEVEHEELWRRLSSRNDGSFGGLRVSRADLDHILSVFEAPTTAEMNSVDAVKVHH